LTIERRLDTNAYKKQRDHSPLPEPRVEKEVFFDSVGVLVMEPIDPYSGCFSLADSEFPTA